jgi:hypothetical protein
MTVELLFWLVCAHYIGDIALQSPWQADNKGKLWYVMLSHVMIWTTCICIPLKLFGVMGWWHPVFLFVGHFVIDKWKASKPRDAEYWHLIYYDQAMHGIQILIVWGIR